MSRGPAKDDAERIRAYLDDELEPRARREFEEELAARPELRDELDGYRKMLAVLNGLPPAIPRGSIAEAVEGAIRRRSRGRYFPLEPRHRFPYESVTAIALLALLLIALFALRPPDEIPRMRERIELNQSAVEAGEEELRALAEFGVLLPTKAGMRVVVARAREDEFRSRLPEIGPFVVVEVQHEENSGHGDLTIFVIERRE